MHHPKDPRSPISPASEVGVDDPRNSRNEPWEDDCEGRIKTIKSERNRNKSAASSENQRNQEMGIRYKRVTDSENPRFLYTA